MSLERTLNRTKALDGVHGVHVVPHSPFALREITEHEDFKSTCTSSFVGANQFLLMQ